MKKRKLIKFIVCSLLVSLLFTACANENENPVMPDTSPAATRKPENETPAPVFENIYELPDELMEDYEVFSLVFPLDEEIAESGCIYEPFAMSLILPKGWEISVRHTENMPLPAVCGSYGAPHYYIEIYNRYGRLAGAMDFHKYTTGSAEAENDPQIIYADLMKTENFFLLGKRSEASGAHAVYKPVSHDGDNVTAITKAVEMRHDTASEQLTDCFPAIVSYDPNRKMYIAIEFFVSADSPSSSLLNEEQLQLIAESVRIY